MNLAQRIGSEIKTVKQDIQTKANINSPALLGTPTSPTPSAGDNSSRIATTSFVNTAIINTLGASCVCGNVSIGVSSCSADKLTTARMISFYGDVTGSAYFNGSSDVAINMQVADNSHCHSIGTVCGLSTCLAGKLDSSCVGVTIPVLDVNGKILSQYLSVDSNQTLLVDTYSLLPATGNLSTVYFVRDTKTFFYWDGVSYGNTKCSTIRSVNGCCNGNVVIDKTSIGLSCVQNVDTTNANNICSGILSITRGGTGTSTSTGNGKLVLNNKPSFVCPNIDIATGVSFNSMKGFDDSIVPSTMSNFGCSGVSEYVARADHSHPMEYVSIGGNSGTATKLITCRLFTINTAERLFDGTQNVTWTLDDIGAADKIHLHSIGNICGLNACLSGFAKSNNFNNAIDCHGGVISSDGYTGENIVIFDTSFHQVKTRRLDSFVNISTFSNSSNRIKSSQGLSIDTCYNLYTCRDDIVFTVCNANSNTSGFMTAAQYQKLNCLCNYDHPTSNGYCHVPATCLQHSGKVLAVNASGTAAVWTDVNSLNTVSVSSINGQTGIACVQASNLPGLDTCLNNKIDKTGCNLGVTNVEYTKFKTNADGVITYAGSLSSSDIPSLDASKITTGIISESILPYSALSVVEYDNFISFPVTGVSKRIYIDKSNNTQYRWNGTSYIGFGSVGAVTSINGKFGAVVVTKSEIIGIENIDNTSDLDKPISTATATALATKANAASLHSVAYSGNYLNLINKPTIPTVPTDLSAFTNSSAYLKACDFKTLNGLSLSGSGNICIDTTKHWDDILSKPTTISGFGITDSYTKNQIDSSLLSKQDVLVSGTGIKTINGNSILGSGNINLLSCVSWSDICTKPTTVSGYGITDVYTKSDVYSKNYIDSQFLLSDNKICSIECALNFKANTSYVDSKIASLVGTAPALLDTLGELADKLSSDEAGVAALVGVVSCKVDKVDGKSLSTNDFTNTYKSKLDSLSEYSLPVASLNSLGGIKVCGSFCTDANGYLCYISPSVAWNTIVNKPTTVAGYGITDVYTKDEINFNLFEPKNENIQLHISSTSNPHAVTKAQVGLGNVSNLAPMDLPVNTATINALGNKQDLLVSGTNIKSIDGKSIVGSGNIAIEPEFDVILNKPTTLSGYGITDAQTLLVSGVDIKTINGNDILGSGNITLATTFASLTNKPSTIAGYGINNAYTITEVDSALLLKADVSNVYSCNDVNNLLITKAEVQDVYDKAYIDSLFTIIEW